MKNGAEFPPRSYRVALQECPVCGSIYRSKACACVVCLEWSDRLLTAAAVRL